MKIKIIVLLLVLGAVLLSGCLGNKQPSPEKNVTPGETITPEVNTTPKETATTGETITPEGNATPKETATTGENVTPGGSTTTGGNITPEGNVTQGVGELGIEETAHLIRLVNFRASSSSLKINKGGAVAWMNLQDNPKRVLTLVSEDSLFDPTNLVYKRSFAYTFNETGTYNFTIIGQPKMNVSVSVVEP
jgi:plastocyanin